MDLDALVASIGVPAATFVYCVVAGLVPVFNAEIFLLAVAAMAPTATLPAVVLLASLGQMVAKIALYYAGQGLLKLPFRRAKVSLDAVRERFERWRSRDLFFFVSALVGLPPFYATSVLAGSLRFGLARFFALGLAGRAIRFAVIVGLPSVGRWIAGAGP